MRLVNIADVKPGDTIMYGNSKTDVTKVDLTTCMNKVHINDKDCYESFTDVRVLN